MEHSLLYKLDRFVPVLRKTIKRKRFLHSLGAMHVATVLAVRHGEDPVAAATAGLLHDCGRLPTVEEVEAEVRRRALELPTEDRPFPKIWHALLSAHIAAADFDVGDQTILRAIRLHPTGDGDMTALDKIVFLADFIEPTRDIEGLNELRQLAERDLDAAYRRALAMKTAHIRGQGRPLHPRSRRALRAAGIPIEEVPSSSPHEKKRDGLPESGTI